MSNAAASSSTNSVADSREGSDADPRWETPSIKSISEKPRRCYGTRKSYTISRDRSVSFWGRYVQEKRQPDFNPYQTNYTNYGKTHTVQARTLITACIGFIVSQTLLLGQAESQAAILVGLVCITALLAGLAILIIFQVDIINGITVHTLKEAQEVLDRPWNVLSALLSFVLFAVGVMLFVADLCIIAFDTLDDEYHAIWITILMAGCFLLCCVYSCALVIANSPPIYKRPNPDPLTAHTPLLHNKASRADQNV